MTRLEVSNVRYRLQNFVQFSVQMFMQILVQMIVQSFVQKFYAEHFAANSSNSDSCAVPYAVVCAEMICKVENESLLMRMQIFFAEHRAEVLALLES